MRIILLSDWSTNFVVNYSICWLSTKVNGNIYYSINAIAAQPLHNDVYLLSFERGKTSFPVKRNSDVTLKLRGVKRVLSNSCVFKWCQCFHRSSRPRSEKKTRFSSFVQKPSKRKSKTENSLSFNMSLIRRPTLGLWIGWESRWSVTWWPSDAVIGSFTPLCRYSHQMQKHFRRIDVLKAAMQRSKFTDTRFARRLRIRTPVAWAGGEREPGRGVSGQSLAEPWRRDAMAASSRACVTARRTSDVIAVNTVFASESDGSAFWTVHPIRACSCVINTVGCPRDHLVSSSSHGGALRQNGVAI